MRMMMVGALALLTTMPAMASGPLTILEQLRPPAPIAQMTPFAPPAVRYAQACCKRCSKGKACGDSCISRDKQCHKGRGCACD